MAVDKDTRERLRAIVEAAPQRALFPVKELANYNDEAAAFLRTVDPPTVLALLDKIDRLARRVEVARGALQAIARAETTYSSNPLEHARWCVEELRVLAQEALAAFDASREREGG